MKYLALLAALVLAFQANTAFAQWAAPSATPPASNTSSPINVGTTAQVKNGGLSVNAFSAFLNAYFAQNVGIGTASPTANLSFGTGINDNKLYLYDAATDKYGFGIRSSQLMIYSGAGGVSTGGITFGKFDGTTFTENMRLTNAGSLGVGVSSPAARVDVAGNGNYAINNWGKGVRIANGTALFWGLGTASTFSLGQSGDKLYLGRSTTETGGAGSQSYDLVVDSSDNVGIGTTAPGAKLEVGGQIKITGGTPGAGKVLTSDAAGLATWVTPAAGNPGTVTSITAGTGLTASPSSPITSSGTLTADTTYLQRRVSGTCTGSAGIQTVAADGTVTCSSAAAAPTLQAVTTAGNTTNLGISAASLLTTGGASITGNLGVGVASPQATLDVYAAASPIAYIRDASSGFKIVPAGGVNYIESAGTNMTGGADLRFTDMNGANTWMTVKNGGNVGIGTTNPTSGHLQVQTDANVPGLYLSGTSAGWGSGIQLNNTTVTTGKNYGIYSGATGDLHFADNNAGVDRIYVGSSGNVGINNTSPAQKLDIEGDVRWGTVNGGSWGDGLISTNSGWGGGAYPTIGSTGGTVGSLIMLQNPHVPFRTDNAAPGDTGRAGLRMAVDTGASTWWDAGLAGDYYHIYRNGSGEFMRVNNSGNVGIGTTAPGYKLDVSGTANASGGISAASLLTTGGASITGNLGVGTASPAYGLDVQKLTGNTVARFGPDTGTGAVYLVESDPIVAFNSYYNGGWYYGSSAGASFIDGASGNIQFSTAPAGTAGTAATMTQRMYIAQAGNVGIGNGNPAYKLDVNGDINFTGTLRQNGTAFTGGQWTTSGNNIYNNNTGNVGIGATSPNNKLEVGGNGGIGFAGSAPALNSADKKLYSPSDGALEWVTNNAAGAHGFRVSNQGTVMVNLDSNGNSYFNGGNVGIGTASPAGLFSVGSGNQWYVSNTNPNTLNTAASANAIADGWINYRGYADGFTQPRNFNVGDGKGANIAWFDGTNRRLSVNNGQAAAYTLDVNGNGNFASGVAAASLLTTGGGSIGGNLGIGTATPGSIVNGNASYFRPDPSGKFTDVYSAGNEAVLNLISNQNTDTAHIGGVYFSRSAGQSDAHYQIAGIQARQSGVGATAGGDLYFYTKPSGNGELATAPSAVITANANVGIGTAAPAYKLDVNGDLNITGTLRQNGVAFTSGGQWTTSGSNIYNGNSGYVGIGTTAPGARLTTRSGTNAAPATTGTSQPSAGLRVEGGDNAIIDLGTNSTNTWIQATDKTSLGTYYFLNLNPNGGNVGIGMQNPGYKLDVSGNMRVASGDSSLALFGPNTTWGGSLAVGAGPSQITGQKGQVIVTNGNLHLDSAPTSYATYINYYSQMPTYINAQGGNVGIGNTAPGYKLDVTGTGNVSGGLAAASLLTSGGASIGGNLGIGTNSPAAKLTVVGSTMNSFGPSVTDDYRDVAYYNFGGSISGTMKITLPVYQTATMMTVLIKGYDYSANSGWEIQVSGYNYSGDTNWYNYSANVVYGAPPFTSVRLGNDGSKNVILLGNTGTSWSYPKIVVSELMTGHNNPDSFASGWSIAPVTSETGINVTQTPVFPTFLTSNGSVGIGNVAPGYKLDVTGNVGATAYFYTSDKSLKKDIKPLESSLDKITKLQGVSFKWKKDDAKSVGLVAQDVEKVYPELVGTNPQTGLKSVEYGNLVAPLIEAVKEQQKEIEELKAEIRELKNK